MKNRRPKYSNSKKEEIYKNQKGKCKYCMSKLSMESMFLHHKINAKNHDKENLEYVCKPCHIKIHQFERMIKKLINLKWSESNIINLTNRYFTK